MLDHQLCFAIYAAGNSVTRSYHKELKKYGITYTQYLVLLVLWEVNEVPVKFIANRLKLDSGSLSPLLKRMQKSNLISKSRKKNDERSIIIKLTSRGIDLKPIVAEIQKTVTCQTGLSVEEYAYLRDSVARLLNNLETEEKKLSTTKYVA